MSISIFLADKAQIKLQLYHRPPCAYAEAFATAKALCERGQRKRKAFRRRGTELILKPFESEQRRSPEVEAYPGALTACASTSAE